MLRVGYESKVTWREETELLRCSPKFHGAPRHDSAILAYRDRAVFCQLIYTFTYTFQGVTCGLALVQPFDAPLSLGHSRQQVDYGLGLCRVKSRSRKDSIVVPIRSLVRGALTIAEHSSLHSNERLVVDALDGDMFLRCIDIFPNRDLAAQIRML